MSEGQTKNAAIKTVLAFHYQVLIGLDKCFSLEDGQTVWFEKDGDVSLISSDITKSSQTEVKDYAAPLTDHHENLWKTLKNWLAPEFNHTQYGVLVLHTTQPFGLTTRLKDWNSQNAEQRLEVLKSIFADRTQDQLDAEKPSEIIRIQKEVMLNSSESGLKSILGKIILHMEADNLDVLRQSFCTKLDGFIPLANRQAFTEGLIGFLYEQASNNQWIIEKNLFNQKKSL
ncbi:adenylate cyclase [Acinetobacter baumannii]|uniref:adenylate cyclase n=1 Tax=Acinetobacter baumannii TaxID=470 RepID=UPI003F7AC9B7